MAFQAISTQAKNIVTWDIVFLNFDREQGEF